MAVRLSSGVAVWAPVLLARALWAAEILGAVVLIVATKALAAVGKGLATVLARVTVESLEEVAKDAVAAKVMAAWAMAARESEAWVRVWKGVRHLAHLTAMNRRRAAVS